MVKVETANYIPERGDVIWISLDPTRGHEQKGRRPALVVSPKSYNQRAGLALMCPISSKVKGYVFEVPIKVKELEGVVISDQVRALDWKVRKAEKIQKAAKVVTSTVQENLRKLILD